MQVPLKQLIHQSVSCSIYSSEYDEKFKRKTDYLASKRFVLYFVIMTKSLYYNNNYVSYKVSVPEN